MNKIVLKLTTAVTTAALLTGSVASVAFGTTTVTVSGNGADSENTATVDVTTSKIINQTNTANIQNNVDINANSGDNTANKNTGGNVSIDTGNANVSSSVSNSANSNAVSLSCGSCVGSTDVKISGNGADSENKANVEVKNTTGVVQNNVARVNNNVDVNSNTGKNEAEKNTGGNVDVTTGNAGAVVDVTNAVNQNVAQVGGGNGGSLSAEISGNGADSENSIGLELDNNVVINQTNNANIHNNIDANANSGKNEAEKNTGGNTSIDTGDANISVGVTNRANFNGVDLSNCDCQLGATVKVAGNGADSENEVNLELGSETGVIQGNNFNGCNGIDVQSSTGGNESNSNTQGKLGDPGISTGNASSSNVNVGNNVNSNVVGNMGVSLPELPSLQSNLNGWLIAFLAMFSSH